MQKNDLSSDESINILDYVEIVAKRKRLIILTTLAVFAVSIVVSVLLPKVYRSTARILPPQQDQSALTAMVGMMGGGMASLAGDLMGKPSSADLYVGMLSSEAVSDVIIDRFKLMEVYDDDTRIDTYKDLKKKVDFTAGKKDGIISITVEDEEPKRAADMANAYVDELGNMLVRLNMSDAGQSKSFAEERLAKSKLDLANAEEHLKNFQSKNKALDVGQQARGAIEGIAGVNAQLAAEEVKLAALQHSLTNSSSEVKNQKAVIAGLKSQISRLEGTAEGGAIPNVGAVPGLGQEYVRIMREYKIQETLVELLTKQYEMAKLSEAKNISGVQVVQMARVPDKKAKPKRATIVLLSTLVACAGSILTAFLQEYKSQMPDEERQRWQNIIQSLIWKNGLEAKEKSIGVIGRDC